MQNFRPAGRLQHFLKNWEKLTNDPFFLELVKGYQIPFLSEPSQMAPPSAISMSQEEIAIVDQEIQEMLKKGAIKLVQHNTKKSVSKFNIYSPKKGLRAPPCDKPKEIEQAYSLYPFQNGGSFSLEGNTSQRGLHVQDRPKRCILFSATKSQIPKICEFQVERSNLSVSLPLLRPGTSTQDIYKTTEGSYFSDEEAECSIDNFSGRYSTDGCLGGGVDIGMGHPHLPTSEFGFSDQYKEICASTMPNHTVFRHGDKLNRYDCNSSTGEKGSDSKTMSRSSEEVISFTTGADSTYWEAGINSHCNSTSTIPISTNAMPANIGIICSRKLQLRNKIIRRGEDRTAMVGTESSLKQWGVSYILPPPPPPPVTNNLRCIFRRLGCILSRTQNRGAMDITREKRSYKYFRTESSKIRNFNFTQLQKQSI